MITFNMKSMRSCRLQNIVNKIDIIILIFYNSIVQCYIIFRLSEIQNHYQVQTCLTISIYKNLTVLCYLTVPTSKKILENKIIITFFAALVKLRTYNFTRLIAVLYHIIHTSGSFQRPMLCYYLLQNTNYIKYLILTRYVGMYNLVMLCCVLTADSANYQSTIETQSTLF